MPERPDECRPVTLPSGETIRVRGAEPMNAAAIAAFGDVMDAVRRRHAAEHPPNPAAEALWERVEHARTPGGTLRDLAREIGVKFSTVTRLWQGYMPGDADMAAIERWLTGHHNPSTRTENP